MSLDSSERLRLEGLYEKLRKKLLDLTLKNQMLNYKLSGKSQRRLDIVDTTLEDIYTSLVKKDDKKTGLRIDFLPDPEDQLPEENTPLFLSALAHEKISDSNYLSRLDELERAGHDDDTELDKLEQQLRERIRTQLGLPSRPTRADINRNEHARSQGINPALDLPQKNTNQNIHNKHLKTLKYRDELENLIDKIASQARLAEQETGVSTLFLAFGFLEWYQSDASDRPAYAPLLLLPVSLGRENKHGKVAYYVSAREDSAETNLSLQKLLEQDYNRRLAPFGEEDDGADGLVETYLTATSTAIEGLKRWKIHRRLVLGHFAFGRFVMYADLQAENWPKLIEHPLVNAILSGTERGAGQSLMPSVPDDYLIDDPEIENLAPWLIQDADASQHSALIDAMRGKNLVIQGPPGTGKSQTIANIIANCLAQKKRILFLCEKQAALDVVKRRLDRADLGDFCLELHSDKASPKRVIESLKQRELLGWGKRQPALPPGGGNKNENRDALTRYLSALHAKTPSGTTPFRLIWDWLRGYTQNAPVMEAFKGQDLPKELLLDPEKLAAVIGGMKQFADISGAFISNFNHHPAESPWAKLELGDIKRYDIEPLIERLKALHKVGADLTHYFERFAPTLSLENIGDIEPLVGIDARLGEPPDGAPIAAVSSLNTDELASGLKEKRALLETQRRLSGKPDLSGADAAQLAIPPKLIAHGPPAELLELPPAKAYGTAAAQSEELSSLIRAVENCQPIVQALGLESNFPASGLAAAAEAAIAVSQIPTQRRPWVVALPGVDESALADAHARWKRLLEAETGWRQRLEAHGTKPWPNAEDLHAAAATLRKSGIFGSLLTRINGSKRAAQDLAKRLGLPTSATMADDIEKLANHARAVTGFEADSTMQRLLGAYWDGLKSPFDHIVNGTKNRNSLTERLAPLPCGEPVLQQLLLLAEEAFSALARHAPAATAMQTHTSTISRRFKDLPIEAMLTAAHQDLERLQSFLQIDREKTLAPIDIPLTQLNEIAALLAKKADIQQRLAQMSVAQEIDALGATLDGIDKAECAINWINAVRKAVPSPMRLRNALVSAKAQNIRHLLHEAAEEGANLSHSYKSLTEELSAKFGITGLSDLVPKDLCEHLDRCIAQHNELASYLPIRKQRNTLAAEGLAGFLANSDRLELPPQNLPAILTTLVAHGQTNLACRASLDLGQDGASLDSHRRRFAEADQQKLKRDRQVIRARLLEAVPPEGEKTGPRKTWTEMSLLHNELSKRQRFLPMRDLLSQAAGSIQTLKPCFMMSPLSLAKFAKSGQLKFDILLIDEASQMKPEEALGGLLRAGQIVVVGDDKQLPPTDFFNRAASDNNLAEDDEDIDDESILEICQKTFREARRLKWHYRSRCESLIAFSNKEFYDNSLITFPMARPGSFSIHMERVNGTYQARRNAAEAACVAERAILFMRRFADMDEDKIPSLGIVTVNTPQHDLIDEELRRRSAGDALVERFHEKLQKKGEPLFVKNLENVQGDERDCIFISLTYGREPGAAALKQRFGPINGKQGHRRLNVLFSRARSHITLFASFGSNDVTPVPGGAEGPHVLKHYLHYAETQGQTVVGARASEPETDFEWEVSQRLQAQGYRLDFQIGVSGYRIDLGVWHPDHPDRFLAGIECDGASYHASKSARDRDRLREEVLRGLGWNILRVWSTDWFHDPELETKKLVQKLEALRSTPPLTFPDYVVAGPTSGTEAEALDGQPSLEPADDGGALPDANALI